MINTMAIKADNDNNDYNDIIVIMTITITTKRRITHHTFANQR